jgi:hypothetical protein
MARRGWRGRRLAVGVLVAAGCGGADGGTAGVWLGSREYLGQVEVVRNPADPVHPSGSVGATLLWTAPQPAEESELGDWERPVEARLAGDRVLVLDRMAHRVHTIDRATGEWRHSIGRRGGGPGEFERPYGVVASGGGVVVGNGGRATLERFAADGTHEGSVHVGQLAFALHALDEEEFVISSATGGFRRIEAGGAQQGALQRTVLVDRQAAPVPDSAIERHVAHVRSTLTASGLPAGMIAEQVAAQREMYRLGRRMRGLRPEVDGARVALWEQTSEDLGGGSATLHFFSDDGAFLAGLDFDHGFADFAWRDSTLYALAQEPATGLVRLAAYRLRLPPAPQLPPLTASAP